MGLFSDIFGRRQKAAPYGMQSGIVRAGGIIGELPRLGTRQLIEGYSIFPWLRAVVDKISDVGGAVPWKVGIKTRKGAVRYLDDHPLTALLNFGNPAFSGLAIRQLFFKYLLICGEFFALLERNQYGMPIALWPVPPHWVIYAPTFNEPSGTFRLQFRAWRAEIPGKDMLHIYIPEPNMPYGRGVGKGHTLGDVLETDDYTSKFIKTYFYNGARPDILISSKDAETQLGPETAKHL